MYVEKCNQDCLVLVSSGFGVPPYLMGIVRMSVLHKGEQVGPCRIIGTGDLYKIGLRYVHCMKTHVEE
jgi:hypothetical protein